MRAGQCQSGTVVASIGGVDVRSCQLSERLGAKELKLETQLFDLRSAALKTLIDDIVIESEAKRRGVSVEDLLRVNVYSQVQEITGPECRVAYEALGRADAADPQPDAVECACGRLRAQRAEIAKRKFAASLREHVPIGASLPPPRASFSIEALRPTEGSQAGAMVVIFSDYQCPYCAVLDEPIQELRKRYGKTVEVVVKNFPLAMHPLGQPAAEASVCAARQGKFWQFRVTLSYC
jgi:hypothetical protein